jgi:predicted dehydrogenase
MSGAPVSAIVIGCGNRGNVYSTYAVDYPDELRIVAVCDPKNFRRTDLARRVQRADGVPVQEFTDWRQIAALAKFADAVIITTPDQLHVEPAVAFANLGYHLLLEKPMATSLADCRRIVAAVHRADVMLTVGHVMRFSGYTRKIRQLVQEGAIGRLINVQHLEPVGAQHFAHSYVRGNWRNEAESCFSLMAKSCHDIDWLRFVVGGRVQNVSSFGSLQHFRPEEQPAAAQGAQRCLDCPIRDECIYSATKIYLDDAKRGVETHWNRIVVDTGAPTAANVEKVLRDGPYGRCAYHCDNDVADNQVVNLQFDNGVTASFTMIAFSADVCVRRTRLFGTHGQLECLDGKRIVLQNFADKEEKLVAFETAPPGRLQGHGGADFFLARSFVHAILRNDRSLLLSGADDTLESHTVVFAAEHARRSNAVVNVAAFDGK